MNKDLLVFSHYLKLKNKIENDVTYTDCPFHKKENMISKDKSGLTKTVSRVYFFCEVCNIKFTLNSFMYKYELEINDKELSPSQVKKHKDIIFKQIIPLLNIQEGLRSENIFMPIRSNIQVSFCDKFAMSVPKKIMLRLAGPDKMWKDVYEWEIKKENNNVIFDFIDTKTTIDKAINKILNIKQQKHRFRENNPQFQKLKLADILVNIEIIERHTVYMSEVRDYEIGNKSIFGSSSTDATLNLYTFKPLENGKIYTVTYMNSPNPHKYNGIEGVAWEVDTDTDQFENFKVERNVIHSLKKFQVMDGDYKKQLVKLFGQYKDYTANYIPFLLFMSNELTFHSCLEFIYDNKIERGVIYLTIIGDTRVGKSQSIQRSMDKYEKIGTVYNMGLTTAAGLIGATVQSKSGSWNITGGALSNSHKGLIALEEIHSADFNYNRIMGEVKSSGIVKVSKAGKDNTFKCTLRIIEISNPKQNDYTNDLYMNSFNNGIDVIKNSSITPESIARQDMYCLVWRKKQVSIKDRKGIVKCFEDKDYKARIMWCWTRKPEEIIFEEGVFERLEELSNALNEEYPLPDQILGSELIKKMSRMSIALAGMFVSTDEKYEKIIVKKEFVDIIANYLIKLYDNPNFNIRKFIDRYKEKSTYNEEDTNDFLTLMLDYPKVMDMISKDGKVGIISISSKIVSNNYNRYIDDREPSKMFIDKLYDLNLIDNITNNKIKTTLKFKLLYKKLKGDKNV